MVTSRVEVSGPQRELEVRRADIWQKVEQGDLSLEEAMGRPEDWELEIDGRRFLLHPPTGQWLFHDRLHDSWEPLGLQAGEDVLPVNGTDRQRSPGPNACGRCGAVVEQGARFCATCGVTLRATNCRSCGAEAANGAAFCPKCGTSVSGTRRPRRFGVLRVLRLVVALGGVVLTGFGIAAAFRTTLPAIPAATEDTTSMSAVETTQPGAASATTLAATPQAVEPPPTSTETTCTNEEVGFTVSYPQGWYVSGSELEGACAFFNPEPFESPEASEVAVAIAIYQADAPFEELVASYNTEDVVVYQREGFKAAGRSAYRVYYAFSESGFEPGAYVYDVLVNKGDRTLVITAFEPYSVDFDKTREWVDAMVASLTFSK